MQPSSNVHIDNGIPLSISFSLAIARCVGHDCNYTLLYTKPKMVGAQQIWTVTRPKR